MNKTSPLKLILPERAPAPEDSFFLDVEEVGVWVSNLPITNTGETSKQTFKALVELNRISISNRKRLAIANMFRPVVRHLVSNLSKYYLDAPIPLTAKNQKIVILCRELHMELANSYKIIIERMASGQAEEYQKKLMIVALHQAIHYLSKVLYYSVIVYNPYPGNVWREIHQLYLFAEQNGVADVRIKQGDNNSDSTTRELYQNALLLAMASPYGLRQKEIENLLEKITEWSRYIHILAAKPGTEGQFFIEADKDNPPLHISMQEGTSSFCYTLDTIKLTQHLRTELKTIYTNHSKGPIFTKELQTTAPLLRKIIKSLTYEPQRGFIRTNLNFKLDIAVGISEIHSQITSNKNIQFDNSTIKSEATSEEDQSESSFLDSYFSADDESIQIVPLDHPVDEITTAPQQAIGTNIEQDDGAPAWTKQTQHEVNETFSCKTINESAGGYCINWKGDDAPKIKVGELIGIQSATDHSQFCVGIARWLKQLPEIGLQLGYEIISPTTEVAVIHIQPHGKLSGIKQKCLFLPRNRASSQPACLLLPIMNIQIGAEIEIEITDKRRPAKLVRLLESTGTFGQYEFTYMDDDDL